MTRKPTIQHKATLRGLQRRAAWPIDEAAHLLGIGRSSIYKLFAENKLHLIKIAGRRLVPDDEITRLIRGGE